MKVTRISGDGRSRKVMELCTLLESMKTRTAGLAVAFVRENMGSRLLVGDVVGMDKIPVAVFGALLDEKGGSPEIKQYNGVVLLEFNSLSGLKEAQEIRSTAGDSLATLAAFVGVSGRSVKVLVPFSLPDGSLPSDPVQVNLFHAHAYKLAASHYEAQLRCEVSLKKPNPARGCRMSWDPDLYYNPQAVPLVLEQPLGMPKGEVNVVDNPVINMNALLRMKPGQERSRLVSGLFDSALQQTILFCGSPADDGADASLFFTRLARFCWGAGIPEEDVIRWALLYPWLSEAEMELRTVVGNVYKLSRKEGFGVKPAMPQEQKNVIWLEEFLARRFMFRRNMLTEAVEFRERRSYYFDFRPVTPEVMNSITQKALLEGLKVWDRDVKRFVQSDRIPEYNPVDEYLDRLPAWDGVDRIRPLARCVPTDNGAWPDLFYTWFLSMVAHWKQLDKLHANSTLPLLVGFQGAGKSSWCRKLLPPVLQDFYIETTDLSNRKEATLNLSRYILINLDEFDSLRASQQSYLKSIIQLPEVKVRMPHEKGVRRLNRVASFIATCNTMDTLTDPSGSRRFIGVEVTGYVKPVQDVDYDQLYAQAMEAVRKGERFWFTAEEERATMESNREFQRVPLEEQYFLRFYEAGNETEGGKWLSATEILERVSELSGATFSNTSAGLFGRLLLRNQIARKHTNSGNVYLVKEK